MMRDQQTEELCSLSLSALIRDSRTLGLKIPSRPDQNCSRYNRLVVSEAQRIKIATSSPGWGE